MTELTALQTLSDCTFDGLAIARGRPWRLTFVNATLADWLRRPPCELRDQILEEIFASSLRPRLQAEFDRVWREGVSNVELVVYLRDDENGRRPLDLRICRLPAGDLPQLGIVLHDVSQSARSTEAPPRLDPLTTLPDRTFLQRRLETLLQGDRLAGYDFAVLFVDLDNFKRINDQHGHLVGDSVLREVASRLTACLRERDDVTRFGGDEFVIVLDSVADPSEIGPIVARIDDALAQPIVLPEGEFTLTVSVGVTMAKPQHHSADEVLRDADRQMYAAKRATL